MIVACIPAWRWPGTVQNTTYEPGYSSTFALLGPPGAMSRKLE